MIKLAKLTLKSILHRPLTTFLGAFSIAVSVLLVMSLHRLSDASRKSFEGTLSQTDLIVGARSGSINLLLYSVFRIGNATNNISWKSYEELKQNADIAWTIPISLGDSHRGFRVVGTNEDFFTHYHYGGSRALSLAQGEWSKNLYDCVIGAEVARKLKYTLGQKIILSHGTGEVAFAEHANKPFAITGILAATGTPIDRSVHVTLEAIEAIHADWVDGKPPTTQTTISAEEALRLALKPKQITAFFVGLKSKSGIFRIQRAVNEYEDEPLSAILPGASLQELWQTMSIAENTLKFMSWIVTLTSLIGIFISLLSSLNERRREISILRAVGASLSDVFIMLMLESVWLVSAGMVGGIFSMYAIFWFLQPWLEVEMGLNVALFAPQASDGIYVITILGCALLVSVIPAIKAYKNSLADGLTIRL